MPELAVNLQRVFLLFSFFINVRPCAVEIASVVKTFLIPVDF
jgi:hypothetical protein